MTLTLEQRIRGCLARHPDWTTARITTSTTARMAEVEAIRAGQPMPERAKAATPFPTTALDIAGKPSSGAGTVSLDKIRAKFDTIAAIERELAALPRGQLLPESDMAKLTCGTDRSRFRRCIENNAERFRHIRTKLKLDEGEARAFWGHPEDICEAERYREM